MAATQLDEAKRLGGNVMESLRKTMTSLQANLAASASSKVWTNIPVLTPYGYGLLINNNEKAEYDPEHRFPVSRSDDMVEVQLDWGTAFLHKRSVTRVARLPPSPGERWNIVDVPLVRRRQTFAVLFWYFIPWMCVLASVVCLRSSGLVLYAFLAYLGYIFFLQKFNKRGGFKQNWLRSLKFWKWFRDYFPIYLHKTVDLPTDKSYIFGYHPHGVISFGAQINFGTEATDFSTKFPGINLRLLTLESNFRIPFLGIYLSALGVCDASRESIVSVVKRGKGNSVMLVLGGAKESLDARPGNYTLTLKNRKGFVKLALETGAHLVPVFGFGEVDVFDQVENPRGSRLRHFQSVLQNKFGFAIPLVKGRGVFNYGFGLLPERQPIHAVVGGPIAVPKVEREKITNEMIDMYHDKYLAALKQLFDDYRDYYTYNRRVEFEFVDG